MKAESLSSIVTNLPNDWAGTTFSNLDLLGRSGFCDRLSKLLTTSETPTSSELTSLGNAEDYLRVSSNISATLELHLSQLSGLDHVDRVFTFSSDTFPVIAAVMASQRRAAITVIGSSAEEQPFSGGFLAKLEKLGVEADVVQEPPGSANANPSRVSVLYVVSEDPCYVPQASAFPGYHCMVCNGVLYINDATLINPDAVLTYRKRMCTPYSTLKALGVIRRMVGLAIPDEGVDARQLKELHDHLQTMSGAAVDESSAPVLFTAGLPSLCSVYLSLLQRGGVDVAMASTAYGGSSQLTDILSERSSGALRKLKFHIQGDAGVVHGISEVLEELRSGGDLKSTTVIVTEIPTNPDMKVPDLSDLCRTLKHHKTTTGKDVLLIVDTTFSPASGVLQKLKEIDPDINAMCFISMSKSISRGLTCAGAIVANDQEFSQSLLKEIRVVSAQLNVNAKPDQVRLLCENHAGVEERCENAYDVAKAIGDALMEEVKRATGEDMPLAFVSEINAKDGFKSSTFSFNLPPPPSASDEVKAGLAQNFVDLLQLDKSIFKPCVSFGQDNGLVYATVPATSTQGAITEEDKGKQAKGGVQLVRLSFPPTIDVERTAKVTREAIVELYGRSK